MRTVPTPLVMCSPFVHFCSQRYLRLARRRGPDTGVECGYCTEWSRSSSRASRQASRRASRPASGSQEARPHPWIDVRMTAQCYGGQGFGHARISTTLLRSRTAKTSSGRATTTQRPRGHAGHPWHAHAGRVIKFVFGLPGSFIVSSGTPARPLHGRHGRHGRFARAVAPSSSSLVSPRAPSNVSPLSISLRGNKLAADSTSAEPR